MIVARAGQAGEVDHLRVSRIDPLVETERYRQRVLETKGRDLDDAGRAMLEEDLRSPCTEEIAVFHAFSRIIREARTSFVVMDTAPTGHTLLLLDATGAYHREVTRQMRGGLDYDSEWGKRQRGEGPYARLIADRFARACKRMGLDKPRLTLDHAQFRRPVDASGQADLFAAEDA